MAAGRQDGAILVLHERSLQAGYIRDSLHHVHVCGVPHLVYKRIVVQVHVRHDKVALEPFLLGVYVEAPEPLGHVSV